MATLQLCRLSGREDGILSREVTISTGMVSTKPAALETAKWVRCAHNKPIG